MRAEEKPMRVVRQTEKIVVDFLAGGIEDGDAGVQVLRHAVRLDGVAAGVVGVVEQAEGVRHDVVVGIEEHNHVVFVGSIAFHHLLDGVDLGAVLLVGHYDVYGHLQQGDKVFFGQLGGRYGHVVLVARVLLGVQKAVDGFNHLFPVAQHREKHQETVLYGCRRVGVPVLSEREERAKKQVGHRNGQQQEQDGICHL